MQLTEKEQEARRRVCLPLDGLNTIREIEERVTELNPVVGLFKIGKESYTRFGPKAIEVVQKTGAEVFLDLKYHDIPQTVRGAARAAAELQTYMFNVHALGGIEMMKAAVEGANSISPSNAYIPKIVGVTILTSIDQNIMNDELKIPGSVEDQVLHLAEQSAFAGMDGIVCSAADLNVIRYKLPIEFIYVTPGIKGINTPAGKDQRRVFTPSNAIQGGSSILVIGRAITGQKTPEERIQAGYEILQDIVKSI